MIGVIAKPEQRAIVEEFFELFKTPWEFCHPGRFYEVVIATADEPPHPAPRLFISYGAVHKSHDSRGIIPDRSCPGGMVFEKDGPLPIWRSLTFKVDQPASVCLKMSASWVSGRAQGDGAIRVEVTSSKTLLLSIGSPSKTRTGAPWLSRCCDGGSS